MRKLEPESLQENVFSLIGRQWAMITVPDGSGGANAMTASWGGLGVLWHKPVAFLFLRPQRYSRELLDAQPQFSVCFLPEQMRSQMQYCGSHSGRDGDKLAACGLTVARLDGVPVLAGSRLALICKKLYKQPLEAACFVDPALAQEHYANGDFHILYVAEICAAYLE